MRTLILFLVLILMPVSSFAQSKDDLKEAVFYYNKGNYSEAVKLLDLYLEKKTDSNVYYIKGYALYKMGRFDEARDSFRQAYLIDPGVTMGKSMDTLLTPVDASARKHGDRVQ